MVNLQDTKKACTFNHDWIINNTIFVNDKGSVHFLQIVFHLKNGLIAFGTDIQLHTYYLMYEFPIKSLIFQRNNSIFN